MPAFKQTLHKQIDGRKQTQILKIGSNCTDAEKIKEEILKDKSKYYFWFGEFNYEKYLDLKSLANSENKLLENLYLKFRYCKEKYISLFEPINGEEYFYIGFNRFETNSINEDYTLETQYLFPKVLFKIEKDNPYYDFIIEDLNKGKMSLMPIEDKNDLCDSYIIFSRAYYNDKNEKLVTDLDRHVCRIKDAFGDDFTVMELNKELSQTVIINEEEIEYHPFKYILIFFKMMKSRTNDTVDNTTAVIKKSWWKRLLSFFKL